MLWNAGRMRIGCIQLYQIRFIIQLCIRAEREGGTLTLGSYRYQIVAQQVDANSLFALWSSTEVGIPLQPFRLWKQ